MSNFISAANPTAPITTEAEAQAAARSSAISIVIGVIVGVISLAWTYMHMAEITQAAAQAAAANGSAAGAQAGAQMGIYAAMAFIVIQAVFAFMQWRNPMKWVAILFIVLIALGIVGTALTPVLAGLVPGTPATPMWQIVLTLAIYVIQIILHVAGMRGIDRLEAMQMDAAR